MVHKVYLRFFPESEGDGMGHDSDRGAFSRSFRLSLFDMAQMSVSEMVPSTSFASTSSSRAWICACVGYGSSYFDCRQRVTTSDAMFFRSFCFRDSCITFCFETDTEEAPYDTVVIVSSQGTCRERERERGRECTVPKLSLLVGHQHDEKGVLH